jgi:charged multivesicular body protein 2A
VVFVEQAMKSMNRGLNLPQIQRIMNEFERESETMDMKEEMMNDAVDDVMDDDLEDEEEEGDKILKQVLDEIGVGISQQVRFASVECLSGSYGTCRQLVHPHRC